LGMQIKVWGVVGVCLGFRVLRIGGRMIVNGRGKKGNEMREILV